MIRICYTIDSPYAGGAERYVSLLMRSLDARYFTASAVVGAGAGLDGWCAEHEAAGFSITRVAMNLPFHPTDAAPVFKALRRGRADIVHVNMPGPYSGQMALLAPLARWAGARRVVTTEHLPMVGRLWKRAAVKRLAVPWIDRVVTMSAANREYLRAQQGIPEGKIEVIYNGLPEVFGATRDRDREATRRRLGLEVETVAIVFVGSLEERKGLGVLIDALARVANPQWRLFVAGAGEKRASYEDAARRKLPAGRVSFLGHVNATDVEGLLGASDMLVLPSFAEGMPYVILEAMACALPVVASRIDGVPEAVSDGETGRLVPAGDPELLGEAIAGLVADGEGRRRMGRWARQRFTAIFTLKRHVSCMEALYNGLLRGRA